VIPSDGHAVAVFLLDFTHFADVEINPEEAFAEGERSAGPVLEPARSRDDAAGDVVDAGRAGVWAAPGEAVTPRELSRASLLSITLLLSPDTVHLTISIR